MTQTFKCPSCSAPLEFEGKPMQKCRFCGSSVIVPSGAIQNSNVFGGFGECHGLLKQDGKFLVLEFQLQDSVLRVLKSGVVALIDFGMVGRLEDDKREQLIDLFAAVTRGDARACVSQVLSIGKPFRAGGRDVVEADHVEHR